MTRKRTLWEIPLGITLLLGMVIVPSGIAQARDHDKDCRARIERQEHKLHEAIEHHGRRSRQAMKARERLRDLRARCDERRDYDHR